MNPINGDAPCLADFARYGTMEPMPPTEKAQQELEQIERQVAEMESEHADEATLRQIAKLQDRIDTLRVEMNAPPPPGRRPSWRGIHSVPRPSITSTVFSPTSARFMATAASAMTLPSSAAWPASTETRYSFSALKRAAI